MYITWHEGFIANAEVKFNGRVVLYYLSACEELGFVEDYIYAPSGLPLIDPRTGSLKTTRVYGEVQITLGAGERNVDS